MKSIRWTKRPITWGTYCIMCIICFAVSCIGGLAYLAEWYSPSWWLEFKEFLKRPFKKIKESKLNKEEP